MERDPRVETLAARYTREAEAYERLWGPVLLPMVRALLDALPARSVQRALDLGAGTGSVHADLVRRFRPSTLVGVDRALGMLRVAPRNHPLACMDAAQLGLESGAFDLVLMAFVLFHLPDPHRGLVEAKRVLRKGGTVALTTWASEGESVAARIWNEELNAHGAIAGDKLGRLAQHELMDSTDKVCSLLRTAGFTSAQAECRVFEQTISSADFLALKTSVGSSAQRFESLSATAQADCVTRARERLTGLTANDFTTHMTIVLASAEQPDENPSSV